MSRRRGKVDPRPMIGDPKFNDKVVTKFINCLMVDGKKSVAESVFYDALEVINKKTGQDPFVVFQEALENVKPQVEVKSRRVGGVTYQVPIEVRPERRLALGIRWLIRYSRDRNEKSMKNKLAAEFMEAQKGTGSAIKRKKISEKWQMPTKHSLITDGNLTKFDSKTFDKPGFDSAFLFYELFNHWNICTHRFRENYLNRANSIQSRSYFGSGEYRRRDNRIRYSCRRD